MKTRLRDMAFVCLMVFAVPVLVALPFALAGFLGQR